RPQCRRGLGFPRGESLEEIAPRQILPRRGKAHGQVAERAWHGSKQGLEGRKRSEGPLVLTGDQTNRRELPQEPEADLAFETDEAGNLLDGARPMAEMFGERKRRRGRN